MRTKLWKSSSTQAATFSFNHVGTIIEPTFQWEEFRKKFHRVEREGRWRVRER